MIEGNKLDLIILGAGGHAKVAADIITEKSEYVNIYRLIGFLDDNPLRKGSDISGFPIIGTLQQLDQIPHDSVFIGIGDNQKRRDIFKSLESKNENFVNIIHQSAVISKQTKLGNGILISAGVVVNPGTVVGDNVILNTSCSIDHDNQIGNHSHIGPGATLGGDVTISEGVFVGAGSTITPQIIVDKWSVVGAGACVIRDVSSEEVVVGIPAKPIHKK